MARDTVRPELTRDELDAIAWAVFFSTPAAQNSMLPALKTAHDKLLSARRRILRPGPFAEPESVEADVEPDADGEQQRLREAGT